MNKGVLGLETSTTKIPQEPQAPDLSNGKTILSFEGKTMDGKQISFPKSYKGKVVLLDFWATWCGPCLEEMPNVVNAYKEFHGKGFEILGITLDDENQEAEIKATSSKFEMTWAQIYQGKGWDCPLAVQFDVSGIPFTVLVDGTTGKIIASGNELRGEGLKNILAKTLTK